MCLRPAPQLWSPILPPAIHPAPKNKANLSSEQQKIEFVLSFLGGPGCRARSNMELYDSAVPRTTVNNAIFGSLL